MRSPLDSTEAWISSRRLSNAWDISGLVMLKSGSVVLYHISASLNYVSHCVSVLAMLTQQNFRGRESYPHQNRESRHDALWNHLPLVNCLKQSY